MPLIPEQRTNNLTDDQLKKLDGLANNSELRYGFDYLFKGITNGLYQKDQKIAQLELDKTKLVEKYEGMINIKKLMLVQPYKTWNFNLSDVSKVDIVALNSAYQADLLTVVENEKAIQNNTEVITTVIKMMDSIGIPKQITKFKSPRSSVRITVDAEWYVQIRDSFVSAFSGNVNLYKKASLDNLYAEIVKKRSVIDEQLRKEQEIKDKAAAEHAYFEKKRQQDAIIIAHTCLRYGIDVNLVSSREDLDKILIEKGEVPDSVIQNLMKELSLT